MNTNILLLLSRMRTILLERDTASGFYRKHGALIFSNLKVECLWRIQRCHNNWDQLLTPSMRSETSLSLIHLRYFPSHAITNNHITNSKSFLIFLLLYIFIINNFTTLFSYTIMYLLLITWKQVGIELVIHNIRIKNLSFINKDKYY